MKRISLNWRRHIPCTGAWLKIWRLIMYRPLLFRRRSSCNWKGRRRPWVKSQGKNCNFPRRKSAKMRVKHRGGCISIRLSTSSSLWLQNYVRKRRSYARSSSLKLKAMISTSMNVWKILKCLRLIYKTTVLQTRSYGSWLNQTTKSHRASLPCNNLFCTTTT